MPQDNNTATADRTVAKIAITQRRSLIGQSLRMRRVVRALGLRRVNHRVVKKDNNCTRGMINKAIHLLAYELLPATANTSESKKR